MWKGLPDSGLQPTGVYNLSYYTKRKVTLNYEMTKRLDHIMSRNVWVISLYRTGIIMLWILPNVLIIEYTNLISVLSNIYHRYDNVTLIPLVLQLGLGIDPIQRMGEN